MFTLDDTENDTDTETDNHNYGFHCNIESISHCIETLLLMPLATFSHFIGLATYIILGVAQCEHTITMVVLLTVIDMMVCAQMNIFHFDLYQIDYVYYQTLPADHDLRLGVLLLHI